MTPGELYDAGQLDKAIQAAIEEVKRQPTDVGARFLLCELLCFAGDFERADRQLETVSQQTTDAAVRIILFRQLIRAEISRQQFYSEGRLPEFLAEPTPAIRLGLDASIAIREDNLAEASQVLAQAEAARQPVGGVCDEVPFDEFRDLDDLNAGFFEVLTSTGKYYWVPTETVELIEFETPERPMDLIWRSARMVVAGGPDGGVYLPAIYAGTAQTDDNQLRLGRGTDWQGGEDAPVRGLGQRMFLIGDVAKPIMQLKQIEFKPSGSAS